MVCNPDIILIADEPQMTALDVTIRSPTCWQIRKEHGKSYHLITHDLGVSYCSQIADEAAAMKRWEIAMKLIL